MASQLDAAVAHTRAERQDQIEFGAIRGDVLQAHAVVTRSAPAEVGGVLGEPIDKQLSQPSMEIVLDLISAR
jgi:hypothetical protein